MFARIVTSCKSQIFFERMSPNSMPLSIISSGSSLIRIIRNNSRFYLSGSPTREKRHSVIKHGCSIVAIEQLQVTRYTAVCTAFTRLIQPRSFCQLPFHRAHVRPEEFPPAVPRRRLLPSFHILSKRACE